MPYARLGNWLPGTNYALGPGATARCWRGPAPIVITAISMPMLATSIAVGMVVVMMKMMVSGRCWRSPPHHCRQRRAVHRHRPALAGCWRGAGAAERGLTVGVR
jgi:hypothetical protein